MGLLDWLISDTGSGSTGVNGNPLMTNTAPQGDPTGLTPQVPATPPSQWQNPMVQATNQYASPGSGPDGSPMPFAQGTDPMTAGGASGSSGDPGLPTPPSLPAPPVPMPQPRPAAADAQPSIPMPQPRPPGAGAAIPPNATSTQGAGMPGPAPGMAPQEQPAAQAPMGPTTAGGNQGLLARALGIDPNQAKMIKGSLAGGLTAAAANSNKPGLAAFAAGAGGGLKGGADAESKIEDKQSKALNDAIKAAQSGDTAALNKARTQLALAQAEQVKAGNGKDGTGSKASVLNTQEQLYLRGLGAVNNDPQVKASAAQLRAMATQGYKPDSPEYKAAQEAHTKLIDATKQRVFGTLGVNEKTAADIAKKPGFSEQNPVPKEGLTKEKFDQLPPGAYFINPADGKLLVKQPPAPNPATPAAATPTPALPTPVTAPAGGLADQQDSE